MAKQISNRDDVIDSRDVIERIEELESERKDLQDAYDEASEAYLNGERTGESDDIATFTARAEARSALAEWCEENDAELLALRYLAEEAEGCADWKWGEVLIRDSYFETYAQELAEECGMMNKGDKWPYTCIDWEQAAQELQQDYTSVDYDGVTYWVRS